MVRTEVAEWEEPRHPGPFAWVKLPHFPPLCNTTFVHRPTKRGPRHRNSSRSPLRPGLAGWENGRGGGPRDCNGACDDGLWARHCRPLESPERGRHLRLE